MPVVMDVWFCDAQHQEGGTYDATTVFVFINWGLPRADELW